MCRRVGLLVIIGADWNNVPADLLQWFHDHDFAVLLPEGIQSTYAAGRMLDYWAATKSLLPIVRVPQPWYDMPWDTHVGSMLRIMSAPKET